MSISYDNNYYTTGTFSKGISPKVNIIARLEFKLTHYDVAA